MPHLFARKIVALIPTAAALLVLINSQLAAQEWTRFRGPNGTG
jgi:hypothetical protein